MFIGTCDFPLGENFMMLTLETASINFKQTSPYGKHSHVNDCIFMLNNHRLLFKIGVW